MKKSAKSISNEVESYKPKSILTDILKALAFAVLFYAVISLIALI